MNCILCDRTTAHRMPCCQKSLCSGCLLQTFEGEGTTCAHCRSVMNINSLINNNYCDRCDANTITYCSNCACYLCEGCWDIIHSGRKLSLHEKGTHVVDKKPLYEALELNVKNMIGVQKDLDSLDSKSINKIPTLRQMVEGQIDEEFNRIYELLCVRRAEAFKLVDQHATDLSQELKTTYGGYQKAHTSLQSHILDGTDPTLKVEPYMSNLNFEFSIMPQEIRPLLKPIVIKGNYYVITKDGDFKAPHTGYVTLILIGGGASGGQGGSAFRGGGGSGFLVIEEKFFMEKDRTYPVTIGKGGVFDFNHQSQGTDGSPTIFGPLQAKGGKAPLKYEGGVGQANGGKGGHHWPAVGVQGMSILLDKYDNIRGGQGGQGGSSPPGRMFDYAGGGGGGGIVVTGYEVRASNGGGSGNFGYGGEGFGSGGAGGFYDSGRNKYGAGGNGANGAVIILY